MMKINTFLLFLLFISCSMLSQNNNEFIDRQGIVSFFSYTSVENIKAENTKVLSLFDAATGELAISMLIRAFVFEKALMEEHFNESYIESDLYPKATFQGVILQLDTSLEEPQTTIIKGIFTLHGKSKEVEVKTTIQKIESGYKFSGDLELEVKDFDINIPLLLKPNIAEKININFTFQYETYAE